MCAKFENISNINDWGLENSAKKLIDDEEMTDESWTDAGQLDIGSGPLAVPNQSSLHTQHNTVHFMSLSPLPLFHEHNQ